MTKIKEIPKIERPREKILKYGPEKLSDAELLAILLRTGARGKSAVELGKLLLKKFSDRKIVDAKILELKECTGLGLAKACEIVACFELGRRFLNGKKSRIILSPQDIWLEMEDIRGSKKEHFVIFYLDARNQKIRREIISIGTLSANLVHPREVFEPAVRHATAQIIVAHNHPSGDKKISNNDRSVTKRLVEAGKILGIKVLDHVIVSRDGFTSLKEKGLL